MENTHLHIGFNFYEKRHLEKGGFETEVISKAFMDVIGRGPGSKKSPERAKISKKKKKQKCKSVPVWTILGIFCHKFFELF
jgi:hypothetical protein